MASLTNNSRMMTYVHIIRGLKISYAIQISNLLNSNCMVVIRFITQAITRKNFLACHFGGQTLEFKFDRDKTFVAIKGYRIISLAKKTPKEIRKTNS